MALYRIVSAHVVAAGVLHVRFATGEARRFDTRPYQTSDFFRRLADPTYFARVRVAHGTVTWPDGHDFDPGTIHARGTEVPSDGAPMASAGES